MVLVNLLAAAKHAITEWYRRRVAYEELMSLSDATLADIGIDRSQVYSVVYGRAEDEPSQLAKRPAMAHRHAKLAGCGD